MGFIWVLGFLAELRESVFLGRFFLNLKMEVECLVIFEEDKFVIFFFIGSVDGCR